MASKVMAAKTTAPAGRKSEPVRVDSAGSGKQRHSIPAATLLYSARELRPARAGVPDVHLDVRDAGLFLLRVEGHHRDGAADAPAAGGDDPGGQRRAGRERRGGGELDRLGRRSAGDDPGEDPGGLDAGAGGVSAPDRRSPASGARVPQGIRVPLQPARTGPAQPLAAPGDRAGRHRQPYPPDRNSGPDRSAHPLRP